MASGVDQNAFSFSNLAADSALLEARRMPCGGLKKLDASTRGFETAIKKVSADASDNAHIGIMTVAAESHENFSFAGQVHEIETKLFVLNAGKTDETKEIRSSIRESVTGPQNDGNRLIIMDVLVAAGYAVPEKTLFKQNLVYQTKNLKEKIEEMETYYTEKWQEYTGNAACPATQLNISAGRVILIQYVAQCPAKKFTRIRSEYPVLCDNNWVNQRSRGTLKDTLQEAFPDEYGDDLFDISSGRIAQQQQNLQKAIIEMQGWLINNRIIAYFDDPAKWPMKQFIKGIGNVVQKFLTKKKVENI